MDKLIEGVLITEMKFLDLVPGKIMHIIKSDSSGYNGFGEAYISTIHQGLKKGWKKHREMHLNIVVPVGEIKFVIYDDRPGSISEGLINEIILSPQNFCRLTIPPNIWMAFQGLGSNESYLINIASINHDPSESDTMDLNNTVIPYEWN